jgi:hypothetical protein
MWAIETESKEPVNVYGAVKGSYFQVQFAVADALPRISGNAAKLILFLAAKAHRHNAVELELSQSDIAELTGIKDHKTIRKIQRELESVGFGRVRLSPAGVFNHVLLDAANGEPLPKPEGRSGVYRYRKGESKAVRQGRTADVTSRYPIENKFTRARKLPTPKSPVTRTVPASKPQQPAVFCKIHPTGSVWQLADGTPKCEGCHPNPRAKCPPFRQPTAEELFR